MMRMQKSVVQARRVVGQPAARELVPTMPGTSARWHIHDYPGPYCRWHYHPEFEIHLIQHGTGRSIVGDHIGRFTAGHLVLVGSNLPHDWISDLGDGEHITDGTSSSSSIRNGSVIASNYCLSCEPSSPFLPLPPAASSSPDPQPRQPPLSCSRSATALASIASTIFWRCSTSSVPPQPGKPDFWPVPGYRLRTKAAPMTSSTTRSTTSSPTAHARSDSPTSPPE